MVELRHLPDNSPSLYSGDGFASEPGDVIDVDDETADRLLELDYYVREEDYDAPGANSEDAGEPNEDDSTVTTADFEDDEIEVSGPESDGKTEAQKEMDLEDLDDENPDPDADMSDEEVGTADWRDDEIDVADAESDGKTEAQQDRAEYEDLVDGTVVDVTDALDSGDVDDLDALEAAEREYGGERVGVLDAIESERSSDTTDSGTGIETDDTEDEA